MNDVKVVLPDGTYAKDENGEDIRIRIFDAGDSGIFLRGKGQVNIWCWPVGSGEFWGYRNDKSMPAEVRFNEVFRNLVLSPCVMARGLLFFKECDYVERKKGTNDR